MANSITCIRIVCSIAMLFCQTFSIPFYCLYVTAGISDMLDGFVARRTNTVSEFGSKLDTIADFIFVMVCIIKWIPVIHIETWMYIWIGLITVIKTMNVFLGYRLQKKLVAIHSTMNKITGIVLFVLPLSLGFIELQKSAVVAGSIATLAAIQEGYSIRTGEKIYGKSDSKATRSRS